MNSDKKYISIWKTNGSLHFLYVYSQKINYIMKQFFCVLIITWYIFLIFNIISKQ